MKIDSPSSITPREASIRLEWISLRILPGVAVLIFSIPLCMWADSILPDGIVPVSVIYLMIVIVLWAMYMAIQYAFAGIVRKRKVKGEDTLYEAETAEEISETEVAENPCAAEAGEIAKENHTSATYRQGIDDFFQSQAESQKKKLDTIHEYLLYIMSPFIYEEDMDEFCTDLLRFAIDHNYRPEVEWKRFKTELNSYDVRHLVWSIATRLGLGKGKDYSNDDCACYIERRFASLCLMPNGKQLSHKTLMNLTVTSNSDQIHCDIQGADGLLFHIPSQLGIEKD